MSEKTMTFHVNPKTGNPSVCRATEKRGCPFGGEDIHFESKEEARAAYEKKQASFEHFIWKSKLPPQKAAVLAIYDPMSEEISVKELWGNKVYGAFGKLMDESEDGTRLVIENGQVWQKDILYGSGSWKFVSGDYDQLTRLEKGRSYDRAWLGNSILQHGGRLEVGGATPHMARELRFDIYPDSEEVKREAGIASTEFTKDDGGYAAQDLESRLDDYVTERWHGLNPQQWATIGANLRKELGKPTNLGDDENPSWIWKR